MTNKHIPLIAAAAAILAATGAQAASPMDQGIAEYKAGKYAAAAAEFEALAAKYPRNGYVHYYLGLCKQGMGQVQAAKNEYQSAASLDPKLQSLAQTGIAVLSKMRGHSAQLDAEPATTPAPPPLPKDAGKEAKDDKGAKVATTGKPKVRKVLTFTTSWNNMWNRFEPTYESTKGQFKDIEFQKVDVEDPANEALKTKYSVSQYPTIIYLDEKGNVLDTSVANAPMGDEFANAIKTLNGSK
jgi:tetratricopeptide (TPR) repeat protein